MHVCQSVWGVSPSTSTQTPATNPLQRCHRGLCGWRNSTQTSFGPHQRAWPPGGGRGAERRGDIIRAAPPPAATPLPSPGEASMTSSASSPNSRYPSSGTRPLPSFPPAKSGTRCSGHGDLRENLEGRPGRPVSLTHCLRVRRRGSDTGDSCPALWRSPKPAPLGARRGPALLLAPPAPRPPPPRPSAAAANAGPPPNHAP